MLRIKELLQSNVLITSSAIAIGFATKRGRWVIPECRYIYGDDEKMC